MTTGVYDSPINPGIPLSRVLEVARRIGATEKDHNTIALTLQVGDAMKVKVTDDMVRDALRCINEKR